MHLAGIERNKRLKYDTKISKLSSSRQINLQSQYQDATFFSISFFAPVPLCYEFTRFREPVLFPKTLAVWKQMTDTKQIQDFTLSHDHATHPSHITLFRRDFEIAIDDAM